LVINATYWIGAGAGAAATYILLNPGFIPIAAGWRAVFLLGALLGTIILIFRHWVPESPRWLTIHGRKQDADAIIKGIEEKIDAGKPPPASPLKTLAIRVRTHTPLNEIWDTVFNRRGARSCLGLALMIAQAFFFNAIFFTYRS
jgi:hypothetical protein